MKTEEYHRRFRAYLVEAKDQPERFEGRLRRRALAARAYLMVLLVGLAAILGWLIWRCVSGDPPEWLVFWFLLVFFPLFGGIRGLVSRVGAADGVRVSAKEAPALFELVESVRCEVGARKVSGIWLTTEYNAGALQRPLFGLVGLCRYHLLLGLPLLADLPKAELRAIVAHELAHFIKDHGSWRSRLSRLIESWMRVRGSGIVGFLLLPFEMIDGQRLFIGMAVQDFLHEFEADLLAGETAGRDTAAAATARVTLANNLLELDIVPQLMRDQIKSEDGSKHYVSQLVDAWGTRPPNESRTQRLLKTTLAEQPDVDDTHPPLFERLIRLGFLSGDEIPEIAAAKVRALLNRSKDGQESLERWFVDSASVLSRCDGWFEKMSRPMWEEARKNHKQTEAALESLEEGGAYLKDTDAQWERLGYIFQLEGEQVVLPQLVTFIEENPAHAEATSVYATILDNLGDERCLELAEHAAKIDAAYRLAYLEMKRRWLYEKGSSEDVSGLDAEFFAECDEHIAAEEERDVISAKAHFETHGQSEANVRRLTEAVAEVPGISAAYFVKRKVEHYAGSPQYVLAVVPVSRSWRLEGEMHGSKEAAALAEKVHLAQGTIVAVLTQLPRGARKRIKRVEGGLVYGKD